MKLKTLRIWLFLLPIIGIIGIVLFVQSNNNRQELEEQHIRSITAIKDDIIRALPDYYKRIDAYFLREGYARLSSKPQVKAEAEHLTGILKGFIPNYSIVKFLPQDSIVMDELSIEKELLVKKKLKLTLDAASKHHFISNREVKKFLFDTTDLEPTTKGELVIDVKIPISDLLRKQERNQIFDNFLITDSDGRVIYPTSQQGLLLFKPSLIKEDSVGKVVSGVFVEQVIFSNQNNRTYIAPIPLENLNLYAVGMINNAYFQQVGLRLNFTLISTLILFLVLLLASIPVLGVMNLAQGDNLTQSIVIQVGVSLIGLALVVGFALSFNFNRPDPVREQGSNISELSTNFTNILDTYHSILENWDLGCDFIPALPDFNELVLFASGGLANTIYFKNADSRIVDFGGGLSAIDLSSRNYYKHFIDPQNQNTLFLDSHYSRTDGKLESVISESCNEVFPVRAITFRLEPDRKDLNESHRFLVIKSSGSILFKSNKISTPISNLQEGVAKESWLEISAIIRNNENSSQHFEVPLYLNGNQYTGVLTQVSKGKFDENIWLIFLVNQNLTHAFSSLSSMEGIVLLFIYFGVILLSFITQKLTSQSNSAFKFKYFLFQWLKPSYSNLNRLWFLCFSYLGYLMILIAIYYSGSLNHLEFLGAMLFSSLFVFLVNLITGTEFLPKHTKQEASIWEKVLGTAKNIPSSIYSSMVFIFILVIFNASFSITPFYVILILTLFSSLVVLVWFLAIKDSEILLLKVSSGKTLAIYLSVWILLIGFLPGYMIQSKTQLFEQAIWEQRLVEEPPKHPILESYEKVRRGIMNSIADPFDPKIQNFIAPNIEVFKSALAGRKLAFPISAPLIFIPFLLLLGIATLINYWVQKNIFFDLNISYKTSKVLNKAQKFNFLCSTDALKIRRVIENTFGDKVNDFVIIDFLTEKLDGDFDLDRGKAYYHFKNYHCLEKPEAIIEVIHSLKSINAVIIITSGQPWKELFNKVTNLTDRIAYSELFSDFNFHTYPIQHKSPHFVLDEEQILNELRREKAYYINLWLELSFDERMVCYSFAQEGFFNISRKDTLIDLAEKGIIHPKLEEIAVKHSQHTWHDWEFFSPVFRKLILNETSQIEKKAFKDFEHKNGNKKTIQISIVSFVLICIALIGIFDKNFVNEAYAYMTGGLGLLGSFYALLNRGLAGFKFGKSDPTT
ncbi:hypothetical protein U3A58_19345 [Algoriphagus sp. C2-6-M1]|uniref:hypothetical protein n=1 Tax=Algoriphagus persicinus TaxID=3108754 RepID=UPI002B3A0CC5|nr:hypothetical protein [Algoriphagus sp. C2-6-M1]MEB2782553.1 hypothetical protein [Algoriphagus sp. C2-6-M1]